MTATSEASGVLAALSRAFRQHPMATLILVLLGGLGWLANQHQEIRAALLAWLASSFSAVPSGWMLISFLALGAWVYRLHGEVRACHEERARDRAAWEIERAALAERVETSHSMVSSMFERLAVARDGDRRKASAPVERERRTAKPRRIAPAKPAQRD